MITAPPGFSTQVQSRPGMVPDERKGGHLDGRGARMRKRSCHRAGRRVFIVLAFAKDQIRFTGIKKDSLSGSLNEECKTGLA